MSITNQISELMARGGNGPSHDDGTIDTDIYPMEDSSNTSEDDKPERPSAAVVLVHLAEAKYRLGVTPAGDAFAYSKDSPHLARMFREGRNGLRAELARQFFDLKEKAAPQQSLADALLILEGKAADATPEELHLRVAEHNGAVYIDRGDVKGSVFKIDGGRWSIEASAPVKFRRTELTGELPHPVKHPAGAAGVIDIFKHLNVAPEDHRPVLAWQVAALTQPGIPHPVLALLAEQGAAKTTATKRIGQLVDPSAVQVRTAPQGEEKWLTTAAGSWVVGLDNASSIKPWFSDALCRAVTGDGDVKRKLYTDGSLSVVQFRRCVILNGIDLGGIRGDLADRLLAVDLHRIPEDKRRDEDEMNAAWTKDHPRLFGALLDFAAEVHDILPSVRLDSMPRMADFARVLAAVDRVADRHGLAGGAGLDRFTSRSKRLAEESLQSDPFIVAVLDVAESGGIDGATSTDILTAVRDHMRIEDPDWRAPRTGWPKSARSVTGLLKRNVPQMIKTGWSVSDDGGRNKDGIVKWTIQPEMLGTGYPPHPLTRSPQVTGVKQGGLVENSFPATESDNPPGGLVAGQAGYPNFTNPPKNTALTSDKRVSGDSGLSAPNISGQRGSATVSQPESSGRAGLETIIIGSLHPEYAMSLRTVEQSVPKLHRDQVPDILNKLVEDRIVLVDGTGKYLLNPVGKDIAA